MKIRYGVLISTTIVIISNIFMVCDINVENFLGLELPLLTVATSSIAIFISSSQIAGKGLLWLFDLFAAW